MNKLSILFIFLASTFTSLAQLTVVTINDTTICGGLSVNLITNASGGTSPYLFTWSPADGLNCTNCTSPVANPTMNTTYTVSVVDLNSNTATDSVTITLIPNVDAGNDTAIANGDSVLIGGSPTASGGTPSYQYTWRPGGSLDDSTIANPLAFPNSITTYTVTVRDNGGCIAADTIQVDTFVGIEDLDENENGFLYYPNPIKKGDALNINFKDPQPGKAILLNVLGQRVHVWTIEKGQASFLIIDVKLETGIYLLSYQTDRHFITKKLVVQ